jgi:hypothetical protein
MVFFTSEEVIIDIAMCSVPCLTISRLTPGTIGPYLAGLIEGDGDIYTPKNTHTPKGSINYGQISITFAIADLQLALAIQAIVGGYIQFRNGTSCHLHVKGKSLFLLISLINGYFRTPKIEALHRLIA